MKPSRRGVAVGVAGVLACLAIAALGVVWAMGRFATVRHLDAYGVAADAAVVSVQEYSNSSSYSGTQTWSTVTVVFADAQGRRVSAHYDAPEGGGGAVPHKMIQVRYDPQDPSVVKPVGLVFTSRAEDGVLVLLVGALPVACFSVFFVMRIRRQLRPMVVSARVPGRCLLELRSRGMGTVVVFSPDGTRLVTAGTGRKPRHRRQDGDSGHVSSVRVWDATTGQHLFDVDPVVTASVVVFSPDGTRLATAGTGQRDRAAGVYNVRVWDATTGQHLFDADPVVTVTALVVVFSPDGTRLATAGTGQIRKRHRAAGVRNVRVWDATTGQHLFDADHPKVQTLAFSPDGHRLVTNSQNQARVFDSVGTQLFETSSDTKNVRAGVVFRPGLQRWIATGKVVQVSDTTGRILLTVPHRRWAFSSLAVAFSPPAVVAFNPDGTRLVTAGHGRTATIWDATTGEHLLDLGSRREAGKLTRVVFSPDGAYLAGTCSDKAARLWDAITGEQLLKLWHCGSLDVTDIAFSPDNTRLATTSSDHVTRIWELQQ